MEKKKLLHGVIAVAIFIALAVGANATQGVAGIFIILAMALHIGESVWKFGRNWTSKQ